MYVNAMSIVVTAGVVEKVRNFWGYSMTLLVLEASVRVWLFQLPQSSAAKLITTPQVNIAGTMHNDESKAQY